VPDTNGSPTERSAGSRLNNGRKTLTNVPTSWYVISVPSDPVIAQRGVPGPSPASAARGFARVALLNAAVDMIRARGLHATTVDELCLAAGVTKGAFFHHFESKEALAVAAAEHWSTTTGELFAGAPYHQPASAIERVMAYLDFRATLIDGPPTAYSCLAGTMTQEAFATHPAVRDACAASIFGHAETLEADFAAALASSSAGPEITARSLAVHTQVVLQGAFVLSKAANDPALVLDSIGHLRRYLECVLRARDELPTPSQRKTRRSNMTERVSPRAKPASP
jgi:TetR/AcrR family transcriptional regulator, transcriptional repressor for nem operon